MSTLGDPLADLGALLAYWSEEEDDDVLVRARMFAPLTASRGFPSRAEVIARYPTGPASTSGRLPGITRLRSSSWRSSVRASLRARLEERCSAPASTTRRASSNDWCRRGVRCLTAAAYDPSYVSRSQRVSTAQALTPGAPYTCVNPTLGGPGVCRSPASPRICSTTSWT